MANISGSARADFIRMIRWIALISLLLAGGALWYISFWTELHLSVVLATLGGVFLSTLLGCGLFAAAFFSDKSGHDRAVTDATRSADESDHPA